MSLSELCAREDPTGLEEYLEIKIQNLSEVVVIEFYEEAGGKFAAKTYIPSTQHIQDAKDILDSQLSLKEREQALKILQTKLTENGKRMTTLFPCVGAVRETLRHPESQTFEKDRLVACIQERCAATVLEEVLKL